MLDDINAYQQPEKVEMMTALLERVVTRGRTTSGPSQNNDVPVVIWKDNPLLFTSTLD